MPEHYLQRVKDHVCTHDDIPAPCTVHDAWSRPVHDLEGRRKVEKKEGERKEGRKKQGGKERKEEGAGGAGKQEKRSAHHVVHSSFCHFIRLILTGTSVCLGLDDLTAFGFIFFT